MLAEAHAARGAVRFHRGDSVAAVAPLKRAIKLASANAEAHETLGRLLAEVKCDAAEKHLRASIASEPRFEFPYINLARRFALSGDRERATEVLDQARALGLRAAAPVEARLVLWWRDVERGRALLSELDMTIPTHAGSRRWLHLLVEGTEGPTHLPPTPPGYESPAVLRRFWTQVECELASFQEQWPRAMAALRTLDELGSFDLEWLDGMPLIEALRSTDELRQIRERFAARAARVVEAYLAPTE